MLDQWTDHRINNYQLDSPDGSDPVFGLLNLNDGKYDCFNIGSWTYAMEVPCGPSVTSIYSGTVCERDFRMLSTRNCLEVMDDMLQNSIDADGTIFSKTVVKPDGYFGEVCYKVVRSNHGPMTKSCNATVSAAKTDPTKFIKTNVINGRVVNWVMSPSWKQFKYNMVDLKGAWHELG